MTYHDVTQQAPVAAPARVTNAGRLIGKRILVIGAGQRIFDRKTDPVGNGRAMALLFAAEGAQVVVADKNAQSAEETAALIRDAGGNATTIAADSSDEAQVATMFTAAVGTLGGLDGFVYNVGIGIGAHDLDGITVDEWDKTFAVNVRGAMLSLKGGIPHLPAGGSALLVSSIASLRSGSRLVAYDTSKAALSGLMRHAAREAGLRGARVNTVVPGLVDTPNGRTAGAGRESRATTPIPLGRMATAWDIARAALFFMSDDSYYITSQAIAVDGGMSGV